MANLYLTFTSAFPSPAKARGVPVAVGSSARSETIEIPSASAGPETGTLSAASGEDVVELLAEADCWVAIGANPNPDAVSDGAQLARVVKADLPYQFSVAAGDKVAVVELY